MYSTSERREERFGLFFSSTTSLKGVAELGAKLMTFYRPETKLPNFIYFREGLEGKARKLRKALTTKITWCEGDWSDVERKIGSLIGYSNADIELLIRNIKAKYGKCKTNESSKPKN